MSEPVFIGGPSSVGMWGPGDVPSNGASAALTIADALRHQSLYWMCVACGYKQLRSMDCYCQDFEAMRKEWAANQNIATLTQPKPVAGQPEGKP